MSQKLVSQQVEKTCEGCGASTTYEMANAQEETIRDLQNWHTIIREIWVGDHFEKMMAQACSLNCVQAAARRLVIPVEPEDGIDNIDLNSLRAGTVKLN